MSSFNESVQFEVLFSEHWSQLPAAEIARKIQLSCEQGRGAKKMFFAFSKARITNKGLKLDFPKHNIPSH